MPPIVLLFLLLGVLLHVYYRRPDVMGAAAPDVAFEDRFGDGYPARLCASTAVGSHAGAVVVYFLADVRPGERVRTGDLVEICGEPANYYRIVGRCKDIINRGGMKISPSEIDTLLELFKAEGGGLDEKEARDALADDGLRHKVENMVAENNEKVVGGVPMFVMNGRTVFSGARDPSAFHMVFDVLLGYRREVK